MVHFFGRRCFVKNKKLGIDTKGFWHGLFKGDKSLFLIEIQNDCNAWVFLLVSPEETEITLVDREKDGTPIVDIEDDDGYSYEISPN